MTDKDIRIILGPGLLQGYVSHHPSSGFDKVECTQETLLGKLLPAPLQFKWFYSWKSYTIITATKVKPALQCHVRNS